MMSHVAIDIDKSDFFLSLVEGVTRLIAAIQLLKSVQNYKKTLMNAHFYRVIIVVAKSHSSVVHVFVVFGLVCGKMKW